MTDFKLLSPKWNVDDQLRFERLLPIASELIAKSKKSGATDCFTVGRAAVRIAYGMVCAEKRAAWRVDR